MSVALPWVLWVTAAAMVGVIAAHLLAVGVPTRLELPTARFVPVERASAVSRARTPTDGALLLLRLLALALAGAAFAGLRCAESRVSHGRLLVLDGERADTTTAWRTVVDAAFADSIALLGVVWRDGPSTVRATPLPDDVRDALRGGTTPDAVTSGAERPADASSTTLVRDVVTAREWRGERTLAGALLRARRAAVIAARGADSLRLEVVTRRRGDATTAALGAVRSTWPGAIVLHEVTEDTTGRRTVGDAGEDDAPRTGGVASADTASWIAQADDRTDDPIIVALQVWHARASALAEGALAPMLRVSRGVTRGDASATADSALLSQGGVLVRWPVREPDGAATTRRVAAGVVAHGVTLVASVDRVAERDTSAAARGADASERTLRLPISWFLDGDVAIEERAVDRGCVRDVHFTPPEGDLLLDPSAHGVLAALASACGRRAPPSAVAPVPASMFTAPPDGASAGPWVARRALVPSDEARTAPDHARLLLLLALLLLLIEQWWRRARAPGAPAATRHRP